MPSSVGLGVLMNKDNTVAQAGGFIIQLMPFTSDEIIEKLENNIKDLPSVTTMLAEGKTPEQMLETVLDGFEMTVHETVDAGFVCDCSAERVERSLCSLGAVSYTHLCLYRKWRYHLAFSQRILSVSISNQSNSSGNRYLRSG